ncbi:MAG: hypothetical protein ACOXZW_02205 [Bacilli bacterium]|jgi:bifunctional N-acetylglucosamine-1-phosphate-uridyltransferase/glucosamine-1-phosphate-acetyltransferase GlmU-like protein
MSSKYVEKRKELTVIVVNPKTPEEYGKMIDDLNESFFMVFLI